MSENPNERNESTNSSLMELLKKYTERINEREILVKQSSSINQSSLNTNEIDTQKMKSQSKFSSSIDLQKHQSINYKMKWEESETKYRLLEQKYQQLECQTIKQMQEKIDELQQDSNQLKMIKQIIGEIDSCRQLTNEQFEQLKYLINNNHSTIQTIANKNDFLQQTRKLREILLKHQDDFLIKIDQLIKKKRKRAEDDDDDDDQNE